MKLKVKNCGLYQTVILNEGNTTIETGLLGQAEANELSRELLSAAIDLLDNGELRTELCEIFNKTFK